MSRLTSFFTRPRTPNWGNRFLGVLFLALALGMCGFFIWLDISQAQEGKFIRPAEAAEEAISRGVPAAVVEQFMEVVQNSGDEAPALLAASDRPVRINVGEIESALAWGAENASLLVNENSGLVVQVKVNGDQGAGSLVAPVPGQTSDEDALIDVAIEITVQPKHWESELSGISSSAQVVFLEAKFVTVPPAWQHSLIRAKASIEAIYARRKEGGFVNSEASFDKEVQFYFVSQEEFEILDEVFPEEFSERMGWIIPSLIFTLILAPFAWLFWFGYIRM